MKTAALFFVSSFAFFASVQAGLTLTCDNACNQSCFANSNNVEKTYINNKAQLYMDRKWAEVQRQCNRRNLDGLRGSVNQEPEEEDERELAMTERRAPSMNCQGNVWVCQFYRRRLEMTEGDEDAGLLDFELEGGEFELEGDDEHHELQRELGYTRSGSYSETLKDFWLEQDISFTSSQGNCAQQITCTLDWSIYCQY